MSQLFKTSKLVRFEHCDPAGLVFYPRYLQLSHQVVEDWFKDGLGVSHADLVVNQKIGIPTVHLDVNFHAATRLEESLDYVLHVIKIGTSSVTLEMEARVAGELRYQVTQVIVFAQIGMKPVKSLPIPAAIRASIARFHTTQV